MTPRIPPDDENTSDSESPSGTGSEEQNVTDVRKRRRDELKEEDATGSQQNSPSTTERTRPVFDLPRPPGQAARDTSREQAGTQSTTEAPTTGDGSGRAGLRDDIMARGTDGSASRDTEGEQDTSTTQTGSSTSTPDDINQGRRATSTGDTSSNETTEAPTDDPTSPPSTNTADPDIAPVAPDGRRPPTQDDPDGDGVPGESQGSYVGQNGIETQDNAIGERAREAEQSAIENTPYLDDADEVRVNQQGELNLTIEGKEARDAYQRQQVKQSVAANNPGLTASEVQIDLDAAQGNRVSLTDTGQAQVAGLVAAPRMGGRRDIQRSSLTQRAADKAGNAVTVDEVSTSFSDGQASVDVDPRGGVTSIASQQGGRRSIQEQSLETAFARDAGNAVSSGEVEVELSDTDPSATVNERTPVVASQQGGRRDIQRTSIANEIADGVDGLTAREVAPNLTSSGSNPGLTMAAQRVRIERRLAENNSQLKQDDLNVTFDDSGNPEAELTEAARRDRLREKAKSQYPNADINVVEQNDGLVAKVVEENGFDTAIRYGQNFVSEPVGSVTEGTANIYSDLAGDTEDFIEGRQQGIRNPGETFDWAVSGVEENTIDPTVSALETVASNPVGLAENTVQDAAGGIVALAEGGANASAGLVEGGIDAVQDFDLQEDTPGGTAGAALLGGAVVSPVPGDEVAVGAALGALAVGGTIVAGSNAAYQEATRNPKTTVAPPGATNELEVGEDPNPNEIPAPTEPGITDSPEIQVERETFERADEIEAPQSPGFDQSELSVPSRVPGGSSPNVEGGEIGVPLEAGGLFQRAQEEEQSDVDPEDVLENPEEFTQRERRELARQNYEQQIFEQRQRYGEIERERVPEYADEPISQGESEEDIGNGIAGEAQEPSVNEDELIGDSTSGIQRDDELPIQENWEQYLREQRQRTQQAQRSSFWRIQEEPNTDETLVELEQQKAQSRLDEAQRESINAELNGGDSITLPLIGGNQEDDILGTEDALEGVGLSDGAGTEGATTEQGLSLEPIQQEQQELTGQAQLDETVQNDIVDPNVNQFEPQLPQVNEQFNSNRQPNKDVNANEFERPTDNPPRFGPGYGTGDGNRKKKRLPDFGFDATSGEIGDSFGGDEQRYNYDTLDFF